MSIVLVNTPNGSYVSVDDIGRQVVSPNAPAQNTMIVRNQSPLGYSSIEFQNESGVPLLFAGAGNSGSGLPNKPNLIAANGGEILVGYFDGSQTQERIRSMPSGDVVLGPPGVQSNAAAGFVFIPYCMGAPTGTPADYSGRVPMIVDMENERIYVRVGNAWKSAQLV